MTNQLRKLSGWLLAAIFAVSTSMAQLPTATISGTVKDASGATIPGATVTVISTETGQTRTAPAGNDGSFRFPALSVGTYDIRAEQTGFQSKIQQGLRIAVGDEAVLSISLEVGSVTESVSVTAEAPIVNTTSGSLGNLVSAETIANLPLDGRNFNDLTLLQPGVAENRGTSTGGTLNGAQFSSNGAPTRSNLFTIDGTVMNDLHNSGASSSNENSLGVEGIREYKVVTNSFSAEYGLTMGSQVTIVTKSGTNQWHGSALEFLRNSALDARNWPDRQLKPTDPRNPAFRRNNFGGSIGGPIKQDKTFFFTTYEGLRQARGITDVYGVPTEEAKSQGILRNQAGVVTQTVAIAPSVVPYLAFWPTANGPSTGAGIAEYSRAITDVQKEEYGQSRLDHNLSSSDSFFGRYTINDSNDQRPGMLEQVFAEFPTRNQYLTLSDNHIFSPSLLGTFRASFSRTHSTALSTIDLPANLAFQPGKPMGPLGITSVSSYSGPPGTTPVELNQRIFSYSGDMFLTKGSHALKFGTLINSYRQHMYNDGGNNPRGSWTFPSLAAFLTAAPTQFAVLTPGSTSVRTYAFKTFGFYLQDDYRMTPTLTFNLGLRYEFTNQPNEIRGKNAAFVDLTRDTTVTIGAPAILNPSKKNISPRFGFAWDVQGNGMTSVRGGFGLLYDVGVFGTALFVGSSGTPPLASISTVLANQGLVFGPFPVIPAGLAGRELRTVDHHLQQPHLLSYNLTIERQMPGSVGLTVAYAGSRGINLMQTKEGNPTYPTGEYVNGTCVARTASSPAFDPAAANKCWTAATTRANRVNPNWDTTEFKTAGANSWYGSLQTTFQKRFSRGMQFQSSYTWGHALDDTQSQLGVDNSLTSNNFGDDPFNRKHDKGSSGFDQRHGYRVSGIYQLPIKASGMAGKLANGWTVSSSLTWSSGFPFDATTATQRSRSQTGGANGGMKRAFLVPGTNHADITRGTSAGCNIVNTAGVVQAVIPAGAKLGTPDLFFNPCAYTSASDGNPVSTQGLLGTAGRAIIFGPNFSVINLSFVKDNTIPMLGESGKLQFRAEVFNLPNHPSFGIPSRTVDSGAVATRQITSTFSKSREVQFALKLIF
ncbi:MAG: hypothetical protein EXQ56_13635 [Acidobacteria bacterium]|nr:hypothetical protein [Acidobacteriota bacterium]